MDTANHRSRSRPAAIRRPVGLALQGGGSWGAYTWGVLDAVLTSRSVAVEQLSGTSAGAINAAIVASALANGSRVRARQALRSFWLSIADHVTPTFVDAWLGPIQRQCRNSINEWLLAYGMLPPSGVNPLGVELLRNAVAAHVDIEAIRSRFAPALFVTVTNVKTGLPRVMSNDAMSIDVLLASASIPELFPAVEIEGEWYWDGGYGGNPTLWPMIHSGLANDLVVVQLMRDRIEDVPTGMPGIRRRVGEIVFNSSLVAEMQAISAMRALAEPRQASASAANVRLHRIGPPRVELFDQGSGIDTARPWLQLLHGEGFGAGKRFMARHGADIGIRETLDVAQAFVDTNKPSIPLQRDPYGARHPVSNAAVTRGARERDGERASITLSAYSSRR